MNTDIVQQEAQQLIDMIGIPTKEIRTTVDNDIHSIILSLRVSGLEEELFTEDYNRLTRDFGKILSLLLEKKHHLYTDIIIDINGHNKKLIDLTKQKAQIAVERVQFFDKPYEFGYLNAYERMLIHSYLKNKPDIATHSHGEGKERRLVVHKKNPLN